jgi:hypothetical protein
VALALVLAAAARPTVKAQVLGPPAGSGAVSVSVQTVEHTGHRLTDETYIDNGRSRTAALFFELDYGWTRRFSMSIGLPLVFARYTDDVSPPPFLPFLPVDQCRCWHSGLQDVNVTARFNLVDTFDHVSAVTPSVSFGIPSHQYNARGEAVIGRHLKETRLALDAGHRLDGVSPNLYVSGRYEYTFVQRVIDVPNNRSRLALSAEWRLTPSFSARAFGSGQRTHGGLRVGSLPGSDFPGPGDLTTPERLAEHDRLLRDNYLHLGVGLSYRWPRVGLFASYTHFLSGTDTHAGRALTSGLTFPFRWRQ